MGRFLGKLSRTGYILLGLVAVMLLLNAGLRLAEARQRTTADNLTARIRQARIALDSAMQDSDTAALLAQKKDLEASLAQGGPGAVDSAELTLKLWEWATNSKLELKALASNPAQPGTGETNLRALKYVISGRGPAEGIHSFLATVTNSAYAPTVDKLTLKHVAGKEGWDINLDLLVFPLGN